MFGFDITVADWVSWAVAIIVTVYVAVAKNPHEKGTNEYEAIRLYRIGAALLVWSFGFGLIGFALAVASFILGIVVIVKGDAKRGISLIVGSIVIPILSAIYTLSSW